MHNNCESTRRARHTHTFTEVHVNYIIERAHRIRHKSRWLETYIQRNYTIIVYYIYTAAQSALHAGHIDGSARGQ